MSQNLVPVMNTQNLRAFFQEHADESVGKPSASDYCPLSMYFWRAHDLDVIVCTDRLYIRYSPETARNLEPWEFRFVTGIDDGTYEDPEYVYGKEALEILDEVLARGDS